MNSAAVLVWSTLTWRLQCSWDYIRARFLGPGFRIRTTVMFFFLLFYYYNRAYKTRICQPARVFGGGPLKCACEQYRDIECHIRFWRVWKQPKSINRKTVFRIIINMCKNTGIVVFHARLYYYCLKLPRHVNPDTSIQLNGRTTIIILSYMPYFIIL